MKKTKRISIEFRHREVTITVEGSTLHVQDGEPDATLVCPICLSAWVTIAPPAGAALPDGVDQIRRALEQSGLHVQVSPTGQLRICQRSFEELKEKF